MTSYIAPIFPILRCTRFLTMCQDDSPPLYDFFSLEVLPLTNSFIFFIFLGCFVIPTPLLKTANIIDMLYSHDLKYCIIFHILGCARFLIIVRRAITPSKNFFFCFLDSIISNKLVRIFYIYEGWLVIPTPLLKNANITDTLLS